MTDPAPKKDLTGKAFERLVAAVQSKLDPGAVVEWDHHLTGACGVPRQVDVAIHGSLNSAKLFIAIEARDYNKKLDITQVEAFIAKLDDIGAHKGILVTTIGYERGALLRARTGGIVTCVLRPARREDWAGRIGGIDLTIVEWGVACEDAELMLVDGRRVPIPVDGELVLEDERGQLCQAADVALRLLQDHKEANGQSVDFTIHDPKFYIRESPSRTVQVVGMGGCFRFVEKSSVKRLLKAPHDWVFVQHLPDGAVEEEKSFFIFRDLEKLADEFKAKKSSS